MGLSSVIYVAVVLSFLAPAIFTVVLDIPALLVQLIGVASIVIIRTFLSVELRSVTKIRIELFFVGFLILRLVFAPALRSIVGEESSSSAELFRILAVVLLHVGMMTLLRIKQQFFRKKGEYTSRSLFTIGIGVYAIAVALSLASLVALHIYEKERSCDQFYRDINALSEKVDRLFFGGDTHLQEVAEDVRSFSSRSVGDALGVTSMDVAALSGQDTATGNDVSGGIFQSLQRFQNKVIGGLMQERTAINQGVCALIFTQIEKNIREGIGSYSVILLVFFLLSPLLSFVLRIVAALGRLCMLLAIRLKRYKRKDRTIVVKDLE